METRKQPQSLNRTHSQMTKIALQHWQAELTNAVRDPAELLERLQLSPELLPAAQRVSELFPLLVPESFLRRIEPKNRHDPLLLQVLPLHDEENNVPGFQADALDEADSHLAPGLLQKYAGRALMVVNGTCAIHCRYCFRRNYPYNSEPRRWDDWQPAFDALAADATISELLLSGGDPLTLSDRRLALLSETAANIPHLQRLRIHTRLPIVVPSRVTDELIELLTTSRLTPFVVVHANHPHEIAGDCEQALQKLVRAGITVLNQSVLLKNINDSVEALAELSTRLINIGVIPYYLHQLDRVTGTAHFEIPEETGLALIAELRNRLPGYAVPKYVREEPRQLHKTPLS